VSSDARSVIPAVIMVMLSLAAAGCAVPHEYETAEYSGQLPAGDPLADPTTRLPLQVVVRFGGGGLRLGSVQGRPELYHAVIDHCSTHSIPTVDFEPGGSDAIGRLEVMLKGRPGVFIGFGGEHNRLALDLSPAVPHILDLSLGEGESLVDLSDLMVEGLSIRGGAGDVRVVFGTPNETVADDFSVTGMLGDIFLDRLGNSNASRIEVRGGIGTLEIDLSGQWRHDAKLDVDGAVGNILLAVPIDRAIRLRIGRPWSEDLEIPGFHRDGDDFISPAFDGEGPRLDVTVEAGIGKLTIELLDARGELKGTAHGAPTLP